jgi:hypothetical protein
MIFYYLLPVLKFLGVIFVFAVVFIFCMLVVFSGEITERENVSNNKIDTQNIKKQYDLKIAKGRMYNHCLECLSPVGVSLDPVLAYEKEYYLNMREKYFSEAEQLRLIMVYFGVVK